MEYSELTRNHSVQTQSLSESRGDLELEIGPSQKHGTTESIRPIELRCGFCYYRFFAPNALGLTSDAKCPHCKHVTSVGPDFARIRALRLLEYAVVALAVAIITSVVTYAYRERTGGLYSVNLGLGFAGLVMVLKAVAYYRMPVSRIVIGGYEM